MTSAVKIGVDFGGTKIEAAALGPDGGFLARVRAPNPGNYDAAIRVVCELVAQAEREAGASGTIGVGVPGSVSPKTGVMRNANTQWLNGRTFREDLSAALGRDIRMANDANCLALSEAVDGAGAGRAVVCAVILGTGCGGGVVVDGGLIEGAHGVAGEIGHMPLPWPEGDELPAPQCWCGQRGCLETWVSGSGFERDHERVTGQALRAAAIMDAARAGDAAARATFERYVDRLGRALAAIVNLIDPDVFVLGGGMSNVREIYGALPAQISEHVFSDFWEGEVAAARWGDSSGVRGAARLW